jgi:hypothetical protein
LDKTAIAEGEGHNDIGLGDASSVHVNGRQDKRGQGESGKTQRSRVGKLSVLIWPPGTRLKSTTKGLSILAKGHLAEVAVVAVSESMARGGCLLDTVGLLLVGSDVNFVSHCGLLFALKSIELVGNAKTRLSEELSYRPAMTGVLWVERKQSFAYRATANTI